MKTQDELDAVLALLIEHSGIMFTNKPDTALYEGILEKLYRVVHVRIPVDEFERIFIGKETDLLEERYMQAIATYLNFFDWESLQKSLDNIQVKNERKIGKSFYVLVLMILAVVSVLGILRTALK